MLLWQFRKVLRKSQANSQRIISRIPKAQYLCIPMSKPKLIKFSEYTAFPNTYDIEDAAKVKGQWHELFGNNHPIVIELACGKGDRSEEHTV